MVSFPPQSLRITQAHRDPKFHNSRMEYTIWRLFRLFIDHCVWLRRDQKVHQPLALLLCNHDSLKLCTHQLSCSYKRAWSWNLVGTIHEERNL